jgi:hypothetical protein
MDWTQILALMGAVFVANMGVIIPLFLWTRSEANSDRREYANERRDILQIIRNVQQEMKDEIKDFHGRLCAIEERNRKS